MVQDEGQQLSPWVAGPRGAPRLPRLVLWAFSKLAERNLPNRVTLWKVRNPYYSWWRKRCLTTCLLCVLQGTQAVTVAFTLCMFWPWITLPGASRPPLALLYSLLAISGSWNSCGLWIFKWYQQHSHLQSWYPVPTPRSCFIHFLPCQYPGLWPCPVANTLESGRKTTHSCISNSTVLSFDGLWLTNF